MKFLIIQKVKQEIPMEKWAKLLPLQFKYFQNLEKDDVLEVYYHLIGQQGSMLVVNVDSGQAKTCQKLSGKTQCSFTLNGKFTR